MNLSSYLMSKYCLTFPRDFAQHFVSFLKQVHVFLKYFHVSLLSLLYHSSISCSLTAVFSCLLYIYQLIMAPITDPMIIPMIVAAVLVRSTLLHNLL